MHKRTKKPVKIKEQAKLQKLIEDSKSQKMLLDPKPFKIYEPISYPCPKCWFVFDSRKKRKEHRK